MRKKEREGRYLRLDRQALNREREKEREKERDIYSTVSNIIQLYIHIYIYILYCSCILFIKGCVYNLIVFSLYLSFYY